MPQSEPLVSVYIACFNYEQYVDQAIQSVLSQTLSDFELIIIDDGSMDGSRERISTYLNMPNVRVIFQENRGLNATNNVALRAARGKYLVRLDADDYLDPNALLVLSTALEKDSELALVFPDYYLVDREGNLLGHERRDSVGEPDSLLDRPAHGACTMFRLSCLLEVGGYSEGYQCQDGVDIWLKITERYRIKNINLPLFFYRQHGENLTRNQERILETRSRILEERANERRAVVIDTVAVLPVRGPRADPACVSLEELGGDRVIDWTLRAALEAEPVQEVIVTTNDPELTGHIASVYGDSVAVSGRDPASTMENISFDGTVRSAIEHRKASSPSLAVLELTCNYPFRNSMYLTKAVNVMRLFDVDLVIGVTIDSPTLYIHDGKGLQPLFPERVAGNLRLEKEILYRQLGGLRLIRYQLLAANKPFETQRVGHVVLSEEAAMPVRSTRDLLLARAVAGTIK